MCASVCPRCCSSHGPYPQTADTIGLKQQQQTQAILESCFVARRQLVPTALAPALLDSKRCPVAGTARRPARLDDQRRSKTSAAQRPALLKERCRCVQPAPLNEHKGSPHLRTYLRAQGGRFQCSSSSGLPRLKLTSAQAYLGSKPRTDLG